MTLDLDEGRRLLASATSGPWRVFQGEDDPERHGVNADAYFLRLISEPALRDYLDFEAAWDAAHPGEDIPDDAFEEYMETHADAEVGTEADHRLVVWLHNNAAALLAAAEERERLRELLQRARPLMGYACDIPRMELTAQNLLADVDAALT